MQINSYIFQSPYPQQVQFGKPDPATQAQEQQQQATDQLSQTPTSTQQEAQTYTLQTQSNASTPIKVAASGDSTPGSSLSDFTTANNRVKAASAYTE